MRNFVAFDDDWNQVRQPINLLLPIVRDVSDRQWLCIDLDVSVD
jgi:hypothetical protein